MSLLTTERMSLFIDAAIQASPYGTLEDLAHFLAVEHPRFYEKDPATLARLTKLDAKVVRALQVDVRWRRLISHIQTLEVVDYRAERENVEHVQHLVHHAEKEADQLRAFMILEQQKGTKMPDRQEVEQTHRVEIVTRVLPDKASGYQSVTPYQVPVSRRQRLGAGSEDRTIDLPPQEARQLSGPIPARPGVPVGDGQVRAAKGPAGLAGEPEPGAPAEGPGAEDPGHPGAAADAPPS